MKTTFSRRAALAASAALAAAVLSGCGTLEVSQADMVVQRADPKLRVELTLSPAQVRIGQPVDVRFNAFAHSPQLVVEGTVQSLASDILIDEATRVPYYLARVAITAEGIKTMGQRQLQPGMHAEVVIRTGERSVLTYLLHPLTKRMAASMKEE